MFWNKKGTGLLPDTRTDEEKKKDFSSSELLLGGVVWEDRLSKVPSFPIFDQDGSGSCVAQSMTKALGILNFLEEGFFVHLSARDFYTRRYSGNAGMNFYDAAQIAQQHGATLEQLMPSQKLGEDAMNKTDDRTATSEFIGKLFRVKNFIAIPFNIDKVAEILALNKPVTLGFRFTYDEWNRDMPVLLSSNPTLGHGVCAVPNGYTLYKGKKCIVIEDSWGTGYGVNGRRYVPEDFFNERCIAAWYFEDINNLAQFNHIPKPLYTFTKEMGLGDTNDEVRHLQETLATIQDKDGYLFPLTNISATGYFGGITRQAVIRFQTLKGIVPVAGYVGPKTLSELNKLK